MYLQSESTFINHLFCPSRLILHLFSSYIMPFIDSLKKKKKNTEMENMTCLRNALQNIYRKRLSFLCQFCFPTTQRLSFRLFQCVKYWYWETAMWCYLIRDAQWTSYQRYLFGLWHIDRINTHPTKSLDI